MSMLSSILGKKDEVKIPGIPADFASVVARVQGREPSNDDRLRFAGGISVEQFLPISTEILAKPPEPPKPVFDPSQLEAGKLIEGKGIYLGTWEPKDNSGRTLGKIFDIYAAPEDIRNGSGNLLMTFNNAVKHVASLRNYHGHDGGNIANEKAILEAVRNNPAALAQWFLPTKELLHGKTSGGDKIQPANLYDSRNTGAFKNTFITKSGSGFALWYWSLTELPDIPSFVYVVVFTDGVDDCILKDNFELSSRVVRAELRP
jgi:hypothetical protein